MRDKVSVLTTAKPIYKIHCGECNWELLITANTDESVQCCPWCGWRDLDISHLTKSGAFQEIECKKHGKMTILLPSDTIEPEDFMDNLFCPFCH